MNEFVLLFRSEHFPGRDSSPEQMQASMKKWMDWMGGIAAQNKLASNGMRLGANGKSLKPGNIITDGPYAEIKETIGGFIVVRAASLTEATELAKGCPILEVGGNVEIRDIIPMNS